MTKTVPSRTNRGSQRFMARLGEEADVARTLDVKTKSLLSGEEFRKALGISRQAISNAINDSQLFVVIGPSGETLYPAFFADDKYDRRALQRISKRLGNLPGDSKWQFFTTPKMSLHGQTPLEALVAGRVDDVLVAAAGFAER